MFGRGRKPPVESLQDLHGADLKALMKGGNRRAVLEQVRQLQAQGGGVGGAQRVFKLGPDGQLQPVDDGAMGAARGDPFVPEQDEQARDPFGDGGFRRT